MNEEYLQELYNYLGQNDESFSAEIDFATFSSDMQDQQYAAQIYNYLGGLDDTFKMEVNVNQFFEDIGAVKKKDEPKQSGDLPSEDGSSESVEIEEVDFNTLRTPNPNEVIGRDTRAADYVDPMTTVGLYPDQNTLNLARAQQAADFKFTAQLAQQDEPELTEIQAQEEAERAVNIETETTGREEVIQTQDFNDALSKTNVEAIQMEEGEAVPYFNDMYSQYGFVFRPIGLGDAMEVTTVLADGSVAKEDIDLDPFTTKGAEAESQKLKAFVQKYAKKPEEAREEAESNFAQAALKAKYLRNTPRINADGTESTVMFQSAVIDGKNVVYPTLFPINPNLSTTNPEYWTELDGMEAYEEAVKRGEVFNFGTADEANEFASGSWKDYNSIDAEGNRFFDERGYDYLEVRNQFDEYERARDAAFFIEDRLKEGRQQFGFGEKKEFKNLTPEEQEKYGYLYTEKGLLRADLDQVLEKEQQTVDELQEIYTDDDLQEVREDFDVFIDKQFQQLSQEASVSNASAKYIQNELQANSFAEFGVGIEELYNYIPDDVEGAQMRDAILTSYQASKDVQQFAADKYEVGQTFLDGKFDEELRGEIVENYAGMQQQITEGLNRGKAGNEILKIALGLEDVDDEESTAQIAQRIVDFMEASNTGKTSRAMSRWHSSRGFQEAWDAFSDNPAELALSFAANSISQMLPYGTKIIGISTGSGIATGAGIGATGFVSGPGGVLTTGAGAIAGGAWGLRTGFAATSLALEYTNAVMEAMTNNGYDVLNSNDVAIALSDENVWAEGKERGLKRGIPIAMVDMLSSGLAGRVFKVGKTANRGRRLGVQVGERMVFDPIAEATGELAAQINVGDEIDYKEIFAEAIGGIGNNAPFAALNMALDVRAQNNTKIANDLTTIAGINREVGGIFKPTPTRVSNWANNMERLGQISKETNQRIQLNLGLRQDALNVLETTQGKVDGDVLNRTMELMAAKQELESTPNRKQVFASKIKEINTELAELADTKKVRPSVSTATNQQIEQGNTFEQGFQTNVGGIGLVEQTSDTDIRETAQSKYTINGKSLTRRKFLNRINDMSPKQLKAANITIDNDEQVTDILTEKFGTDAIQEQETGSVSPNQRTGDIQSLEEAVRTVQQEQTTEPETTQEGTVVTEEQTVEEQTDVTPQPAVVPQSLVKPTRADVTAFDNNTIDEARLDRILAGIADKQIANKKLTVFQQRVAENNQARIDEIVSSKTLTDEVADLEATLQTPKGKVDFKSESKFVPDTDEVSQITTTINESQSGNVFTDLEETTDESASINVDELNQRTDNDIQSIEDLSIVKGVPVVFTISDQLTTGPVTNELTGNTIDNLRGGLGFTGTEGNQNAAWANTTEAEAGTIIEKATQVYEANKPTFEEFWAANPEYNGHVPMPVVKMGEGSILSNEATFRVFKDNLSKIPEANRKKALDELVSNLQARIDTRQGTIDKGQASELTIRNYKKEVAGLQELIKLINESDAKLLDDVVSTEFIQQLSLPTRRSFIERLTFGQPNRARTSKKPSKGQKKIPNILIEGMDTDAVNLVHLATITDLITEPQLKDVPQRSIIALQAVDVLNPKVIKSVHPNYPFGVKGKTIGVLQNPQSIVSVYPEAYQNAIRGLVAEEGKGKVVTEGQRKRATIEERKSMPKAGELAPSSVGTILTETLGVQNGLPNTEFVGAISQGNVDNATKLTAFMNVAFPQTNITTDRATFDTVMEQDNVQKYKKGDQIIYGVTVDGDIYINPDVHNSESALFNTSIHEMGHVWTDYLQTTKKGKAIYAKGVNLVKQTQEYQRQLKKFDGNEAKAANETIAILIGNKGQTIADASLKSKFQQWLLGMWNYIKSQFTQTQDLTAEQIQDLTLDEFIGSALADIFAGKQIKLTDSQLKKMKNPEAAFSSEMSITAIVERGRENGFSDASIREVLRGRGFAAADINEAMTYQVDLFNELPQEFRRVEGGILRAAKLFNDVNVALQKFATSGRANVIGARRVKSFADIRQKAQELIQDHPIYKEQNEQVQMELRSGLDRSLGYRGNKNVSQEIGKIREALKQRKVGVKNLKDAQLRLKNFIRANLPKSKNYSQAQINRLINTVANTNLDNFQAQTEKVLKIVEQQRAKIKRDVIADIIKTVKAKARPRKQSGKPRPKGIDAIGQVVFANIKTVMDAVSITNPEARAQALQDIKDKLEANRIVIDNAIQKQINNEELTLQEESLMQLQLAYDQFSDLDTASLEVAQALLEDVKQQKAESILRFSNRRLQKAARAEAVSEEATNQIKETNGDLFNEDGSLKDSNELNEDRDAIQKDFTTRGIVKKVFLKIRDNIFGRAQSKITNFKNLLTHLGTVTNFLDRKNKGLNIFRDKVYRKLNRMEEVALQNMRVMRQKVDEIASEAGIEGGFIGVESLVNRALGTSKTGVPNTKTLNLVTTKTGRKYKSEFNANQLLRIYALSKNPVQRAKLEAQGVTDAVLADIATDLGPELTSFADKMVDYLSTDYFNQTNSVYKQVNGVNLGFVENYFPTKTIAAKVDAKMLEDGDFNGIFSAETAPAFKDRVDYGSDVNLKEGTFTNVLMNHMETMERYKAMAPGVQELNSFFNIPAVNTLLDVSGTKSLVKTLVNATVNPQSAAKADGVSSGVLEWFQRKFTSFALAFKVIQIAKQATSFVNAFEQYSYLPKDSKVPKALQGPLDLMMFTVDGAGVLFDMAKDLVGLDGAISKARKMSAQFDQRVREGLEGDVYGLETGSQTFKQAGKGTSLYRRFVDGFKRLSSRPTIIGDIMGVMGYYINYKRNIANGMSEAQALEEFNDYNSTQQTRRATEKIPLQLKGDFASKGFTMFGSTLFLQINKVMSSATNIMRALGSGKVPSKQDIRGFYLNFAVANVLFTGMSNIALLTRGDSEDRDSFYRKLKDAMMGLNLMYQIPYLGAAIEKGINTYRGDRKPVSDVTNPFASIQSKIQKNFRDNPDSAFKNTILPLIEIAMGAQVDPFIGMFNASKDILKGDMSSEEYYNNVYDFLGITPSYRPGYGKKGSSVKGIIPQGGIKTKTDLKRYDPELYEQVYGERDRIKKEQKELRRQALEDLGYKEVGGKLYPIE